MTDLLLVEKSIADYVDAKYAVAVFSDTAAFHFVVLAADVFLDTT